MSSGLEPIEAFLRRRNGDAQLAIAAERFETLRRAGIVSGAARIIVPGSEPAFSAWGVVHSNERRIAGGLSADNDVRALIGGLSEALERYVWMKETDYFDSPITARGSETRGDLGFVPLTAFAGFSEEHIRSLDDTPLLWVRGTSLLSGNKMYLPANTVSAAHADTAHEPLVRPSVSTGLATGPSSEFAALGGLLEIIERDAFMISWLNALPLPCLDPRELCASNASLGALIDRCDAAGVHIHAKRLVTDAPAYVIAAGVSGGRDPRPPMAIGLKAHRDAGAALEGALLEALRARLVSRHADSMSNFHNDPRDYRHRLRYWNDPAHAHVLEAYMSGTIEQLAEEEWTRDTDAQHIARIVRWAASRGYECITVDLSHARANPTDLRIIMSVIPQLQPMHLDESQPAMHGARLTEIPQAFGYATRKGLVAEPHPIT